MNKDQIIGGILGVVVGDALGLPVQFSNRDQRKKRPVVDMEGWGCFNLPPGTWSDDSSLTLCLVDSICQAGLDPEDAGRRFVRWYSEGYWTPQGYAFDIGGSTAQAMENMKRGIPAAQAGPSDELDNGNGSLMRILPAALYLAEQPREEMLEGIWIMSGITHGHPRARTACYIYSLLVRELLAGSTPATAYKSLCYNPAWLDWPQLEIEPFARILAGDMHHVPAEEIDSSGYVVDTLEAAIWCLLKYGNFEDTVLAAVNLGGDTDTVAAVAGGLAGIAYGRKGIPDEWVEVLPRKNGIIMLLDKFVQRLLKRAL